MQNKAAEDKVKKMHSPVAPDHYRFLEDGITCITWKLLRRSALCLRAIPASIIMSGCFVHTHNADQDMGNASELT